MHRPIPMPSTSMSIDIVQYEVSASMRESRYRPTAITSEPATGKIL